MKRPIKEDFKKGVKETTDFKTTQLEFYIAWCMDYSEAQDEYIDYLEEQSDLKAKEAYRAGQDSMSVFYNGTVSDMNYEEWKQSKRTII